MLPPGQPGDTTIIPPVRPGDTAMMPPAADHPDDQGARWAARAGVPRPEAADEEWVPTEEPAGIWWLPLALGIGGLLLLAAVGVGVWFAFRHSGNAPAPVASATVTASPAAPSPTPTASPTPSPSPTSALVSLPDLRGVAAGDAQQTLVNAGLTPVVRNQVDDSVPVGVVIGTDPPAGSQVPVGSTVTLLVAVAPPTSAAPSPPKPSKSPSPTPSSTS
jgi:hypothetical protein